MSSIPKKVTKIIRKDGISYRAAGGAEVASSADTKDLNNTGKKKGKVIKRADGTTILVVNGKVVKTLQPDSNTSKNVSSNMKIDNLAEDISSDELSPNILPVAVPQNSKLDKLPIDIKRTISFGDRKRGGSSGNSKPLLQTPLQRPGHVSCDRNKNYEKEVPRLNQKRRGASNRSRGYRRPIQRKSRSRSRSRSTERTRSRHEDRSSRKTASRRRRRSLSRSPVPDHSRENKKPITALESSLNKLASNLDLPNMKGIKSEDDILDMIQTQAEEMMQAQHGCPIDNDKKMKLRKAMQDVLARRGLLGKSNTGKVKNNSTRVRSKSTDSSDGRGSPKILEKLNKKYNTVKQVINMDQFHQELQQFHQHGTIPDIDNISVASGNQEISDVSNSDMEMSDEAPGRMEDGATPAYRRMAPQPQMTSTEDDQMKPIQIRLGRDEDEKIFQALAGQVDLLTTSKDVQGLIGTIEDRIKSFLEINMDPLTLEKRIKRYQALVARVVVKAETITETEDDNKVTFHRYDKRKEKQAHESVSYPMPKPEEEKPWMYPASSAKKNNNTAASNPFTQYNNQKLQPSGSAVPEVTDPYSKISEQYISQKNGCHVCLLCMMETDDQYIFMQHLNSRKHHDLVSAKVKQMSTPTNTSKFRKHDLVIRCKLCDIICRGQDKYNDHTNHRSHQALIQAYIKIGRVVPEPEIIYDHEEEVNNRLEEFVQESGTPAVGREFMSVKSNRDCDDNVVDVYYCSICKTTSNSEIQVEKHVRSKKHYLIYTKITQPDVSAQMGSHVSKRKKAAANKVVSDMRTIKRMEEVIEQNKLKFANQSSASSSGFTARATPTSSQKSSIIPRGFQMGPGRVPISNSSQVTKQPPFPEKPSRTSIPPAPINQPQPQSGASTGYKSTFSALQEFRNKYPERSGPGYYTLPNRNQEPFDQHRIQSSIPDQTYFSDGPVPSVIPNSSQSENRSENQSYVYDPLIKSTYSVAKQAHQDLYDSVKKPNTGQGAGFPTYNTITSGNEGAQNRSHVYNHMHSGNESVENPFSTSCNPNLTPGMYSEKPSSTYNPNMGSAYDKSSGTSNYNPSSMHERSSTMHSEPPVSHGSYSGRPNNQYGGIPSQGQYGNYNNNWQTPSSSTPQQQEPCFKFTSSDSSASRFSRGYEASNQPAAMGYNQPHTYNNEQSGHNMTYSGHPTYTGAYTNVRK